MNENDLIASAVRLLREGGLVAMPTETVYGLAADAENELAVRRIFAVKGRPSTHPLIVHLADASQLPDWVAEVPQSAQTLAGAFWPGPLTLVLRKSSRACDAVTGGQETVALRVPAHPMALALLRAFGGGLAAPSANRFGRVSPTTAAHVRADLGDEVDLILDGGPCTIGVESTIVDLSSGSPAILRPGAISAEDLERVLGCPVPVQARGKVRVPGTLPSHYAPRAGVIPADPHTVALEAESLRAAGRRVAVMAPRDVAVPRGVGHFVVPADAAGFARVLYATLREIDRQGYEVIVVVLPPEGGIGAAVRDRLMRAAGPRQ